MAAKDSTESLIRALETQPIQQQYRLLHLAEKRLRKVTLESNNYGVFLSAFIGAMDAGACLDAALVLAKTALPAMVWRVEEGAAGKCFAFVWPDAGMAGRSIASALTPGMALAAAVVKATRPSAAEGASPASAHAQTPARSPRVNRHSLKAAQARHLQVRASGATRKK